MKVQYHDPAEAAMIDQEWRSAKCDDQARLEVTIAADSPSTAALGGWTDNARMLVSDSVATQLPSVACSEIKIFADPANTKTIYFGGASVTTTNGSDMVAREVETLDRMTNANECYFIAASGDTGQYIRFQTR